MWQVGGEVAGVRRQVLGHAALGPAVIGETWAFDGTDYIASKGTITSSKITPMLLLSYHPGIEDEGS
jgi:hypothetical protein